MKKQILTFVISILIVSNLFCQKGSFFASLGPTIAFPFSNKNFSNYYKNGIGGSLQSCIGVSKLGAITFCASYVSIGAKQPYNSENSLTLIKIGYRTNFSNSRFFASTDAGLARYNSGSSHFVISVTAGYSFNTSKRSYVDLFPSYNQIIGTLSNSRWLTANILYRFNLRKN